MYCLEYDLVKDFLHKLPSSPFAANGKINYSTEFDYSRGRTDIIMLDHNNVLFAFEAKLLGWRKALDQAYRNTCFAHYSYILVPENVAKLAGKYYVEFFKRSVGICFISDNRIVISLEAEQNMPLQEYLYERAKQSILDGDGNVRTH